AVPFDAARHVTVERRRGGDERHRVTGVVVASPPVDREPALAAARTSDQYRQHGPTRPASSTGGKATTRIIDIVIGFGSVGADRSRPPPVGEGPPRDQAFRAWSHGPFRIES